jgi:hypothetical protein
MLPGDLAVLLDVDLEVPWERADSGFGRHLVDSKGSHRIQRYELPGPRPHWGRTGMGVGGPGVGVGRPDQSVLNWLVYGWP